MDINRPKSHTGDYNIKRRFGKGFRNSKKNIIMFASSKKEESVDENFEKFMNTTPHRSCSLNALHTGQILLQPRMAQLETLEAKMARIENSLSTTPRKKKISSSNNSITSALTPSNINSTSKINTNDYTTSLNIEQKSSSTFSKLTPKEDDTSVYKTSKDIAREMDALKNALKNKEHVINSLKGQLNSSISLNKLPITLSKSKTESTSLDRKVTEENLEKLNNEMENKTLLIKNIKLELERLDITDNIDVRIQQAELEYQLGREELNLLSILEEIQSLKASLEECETNDLQNENSTLFSFVQNEHSVIIHASEIVYDSKSPRFGTSLSEDGNGLCVEWSAENSELMKGDRLLEINGKIMFNLKNRDDMIRLLSISPNPAQIVVLRPCNKKYNATMSLLQEELDVYREKAGEAERIRDSFRSDNLRLTHRISYLEEQVAELLSKVSKNELSSTKNSTNYVFKNHKLEPQVQIFQKGSKVTVIGNTDSNRNSSRARHDLPTVCNKSHNNNENKSSEGEINNYNRNNATIHLCATQSPLENSPRIYGGETPKKKNDSTSRCSLQYLPELNYLRNQHLNVLNTPVNNNDNTKNKENCYNSIHEKKIKYNKESPHSLFNNAIKSSGESNYRYFKEDRSCKSVDFDSEPNYQSLKNVYNGRSKMYDSETSSDYVRTMKYPRPIPPQKPLRLSLHKGCSLQSVKIIDKSGDNNSSYKKYPKRSHKSDAIISSNSEDNIVNHSNDGKSRVLEKWC